MTTLELYYFNEQLRNSYTKVLLWHNTRTQMKKSLTNKQRKNRAKLLAGKGTVNLCPTGVDHGRLAYHEARLLLLRGSILVWTTPLLHTCVWLLKMCDPQQAVLPKPLFLWTKPPQQMCDMAEYFIWPQDLDINASSRLSWSWFNLRVCFSLDGPENRISLITFI